MMMMSGFNGPIGWLTMAIGVIIHIAFAAMVVLAAVWLFRSLFRDEDQLSGSHKAEIILKQRFAKGEITADEYRHMRDELTSL